MFVFLCLQLHSPNHWDFERFQITQSFVLLFTSFILMKSLILAPVKSTRAVTNFSSAPQDRVESIDFQVCSMFIYIFHTI